MNPIEKRLRELRAESEKGQRQLEGLDRQRQEMRDTLLRISGAIQVLEELLRQPADAFAKPETEFEAAPANNGRRENAAELTPA
jgi:hypothetical protein